MAMTLYEKPMPKPLPPYCVRETTRHGRHVYYVRRNRGARIRIKAAFGSPEFEEAYFAAIMGERYVPEPEPASGSLAWLIKRYQASGNWSKLSPATKKQRLIIYRKVLETSAHRIAESITKQAIIAGIDLRRDTPFAANNFLKAMSPLFKWALERNYVKVDPTADVRGFGNKTDGFHAWTEDEIKKYEDRWPIGSRERLAIGILLFTGLRRGDAARLGPQHIRENTISIRTEKTGAQIEIPILPALAEIIAATKTGAESFIAKADGQPMTKDSFGNWFRMACNAAGVPGAAHGLRKAGATRAANNGATESELNAIFGWTDAKMASVYTRNANRAQLARRAMEKMVIPAPSSDSKGIPETS